MNINKKPIPVTIVTGHLGSGKTTFIQKILNEFHEQKFLIIENEFGEIGIDGEVLASNKNALIEMNNGCVCCNIQSDLTVFLEKVIAESTDVDHIIIEATGVANPAKIVLPFVSDSMLKENFELNSVICVIDSIHYKQHRELKEFELQLLTSDTYYISKVSEDIVTDFEKLSQELKVDHQDIINEKLLKDWFFSKRFQKYDKKLNVHSHKHYQKFSISFEGDCDPMKIERYLNVLFAKYRGRIYRSKGILYFKNNAHPYLFQGVFDSLEFHEYINEDSVNTKQNRVTFIGEMLKQDIIEKEFLSCLAIKR